MDVRPENQPPQPFVLGANHLTASVALRDRLLFAEAELADDLGLDMPIASEVYHVCHQGRTAAEAYADLLRRDTGREMDGISPAR